MKALHFCMATTFYPPYSFGGDGVGVQRLSRALVRRGHRVTVIHEMDAFDTLRRGPTPEPPVEDDGVRVIGLRSRLGSLSPVLTHQTGRPVVHRAAIDRILESDPPDVINYHNISLVGGPGILSLGDAVKVYMAHDHWLVCPSHVLWRHGREVCTGRECTRCVLSHGRPPQYWRYTDYLERRLDEVDLFIAMSEFSRDKHREFGFTRPMEVLPYFLPEPSGQGGPVSADSPHHRPYFLFVGRLERIKGLDDVIPAFRGYEGADLLIAGAGEHEPALRRLAGGDARIRFLGKVAPDDLSRYYAHAIALVVPSVCFETFGIILIEAFRQGTPVIARRMGPFPEIVERSGGGYLFTTPDELVSAMRQLQRSPERRRRVGESARRGFLANWTEGQVVPRYLELIRRTAERKGDLRTLRALDAEVLA